METKDGFSTNHFTVVSPQQNLHWSCTGQKEAWQSEPRVSPQIESDYQMNPSAVSLSDMPFPIVCLPTSLPQPGLREAGKMDFTSQV